MGECVGRRRREVGRAPAARARWIRAATGAAALLGVLAGGGRPARAVEAWDGRVQLHGFGETVARTISSDFSDDFDLTQWQWVVNLELEVDLAPRGWGPFELISGFARVEARYDCMWQRACWTADSVNAYGDRAEQGPFYVTSGEDSPFTAATFGKPTAGRLQPDGRYIALRDLAQFEILFEQKGPDQVADSGDEPAELVFGRYADYTLTSRRVRGPLDGMGTQIFGPWRPRERIEPVGALADVPNALSPLEANVATMEPFPGLSKPFRPFPRVPADRAAPRDTARGLYFPSPGLRELLRTEELDPFDQDFRQRELEWNRGGSQQDEKELKEAYLDIELFDGRLWVRLGKQTIVWGKTEIFRSQDQFNPQDLSLSTLPSLEESRVGLWALRAVWSFYDVGPVQDVRLELAALLDDFEPIDIGRCGEPYAPFPACTKSLGLFFHGLTGAGLAGEVRPPAWWNDTRGIEAGARLEFRWRRFSFALTDYYGFSDTPYPDPVFRYTRNVDPRTGRPRRAESAAGCDPEGLFDGDTAGCLGSPRGARLDPAGTALDVPGRIPAARRRFEANGGEILAGHPANQGLFHVFCAATTGFTDLLPGLENECVFNILSSQAVLEFDAAGTPVEVVIAEAAGQLLTGSNTLLRLIEVLGGDSDLKLARNLVLPPPLVPLNTRDPRTGEGRVRTGIALGGLAAVPIGNLSSALTPEQQGLLGCGAFYGTRCDDEGIDLLNTEASALLQSFPGFDGTPLLGFTTLRGSQPGTLGFEGGPVCTRFADGEDWILPGCRGPEDPGYDPAVDGVPVFRSRLLEPFTSAGPDTDTLGFNNRGRAFRAEAGLSDCPEAVNDVGQRLFHPLTCAPFRSEMAALSYNLMMVAVLLSFDRDDDGFAKPEDFDEFDPDRPFAADRCSFAAPQYCLVVRGLLGATGVGRQDLRAGGNLRFGRRDFLWHGGQELVLRYARRNVLGFSMDFAEDWSKTNWSLEFTWIESNPVLDRDSRDGVTEVDAYNLTVSVDRPTFVNFLNAGRTFLINLQLFLGYVPQHTPAFQANGPWNLLATVSAFTAYFQDRLFAGLTLVHDVQSTSGAAIPQVSYRFSERFSARFGMAFFYGRFQPRTPFLSPQLLQNRTGRHAYTDFVENGLAIVRDRDEAFLTLRWTF